MVFLCGLYGINALITDCRIGKFRNFAATIET